MVYYRIFVVCVLYYVVDFRLWLIIMGVNLWGVVVMFICWVNEIRFDSLYWGIFFFVLIFYSWVCDIINEVIF